MPDAPATAVKPRARPAVRKPTAADAIARNWKAVSVVAALAILASGYFGLIHPVLTAMSAGGRYDVAAARARLAEREARLAELETLQRQYTAIGRQDLERLGRFLPAESDVPGLVTALDELSRLAGLQLLAIDTQPRKDAVVGLPSVGATDVAVSLAGGDYPKLKALLRNLETSLRLLDVTAIAFQSATSYTLNLRTYHLLKR